MNEDQSTENSEAAKKLEGRSVKSVDLSERWSSLQLELDDGSTVRVDALRTGKLEIGYLSPHEAFELDRSVMEEQIAVEANRRLRREGHLPALFDDRLEWVELPPVSGCESGGTWSTHETRIGLEGGVLRAYRVSDGSRLVDQGDIGEIFGAADGPSIDDEKIGKAISKALTRRQKFGTEPGRG